MYSTCIIQYIFFICIQKSPSVSKISAITSQALSRVPDYSTRTVIDNLQEKSLPLTIDNSEKIDKILKNQFVILNQIAGFNVVMDELLKKVDKLDVSMQTTEVSCNHVDTFVKQFEPLDSKVDMDKLENKLKNEATMLSFIDKYSYICGKTRNENGLNVCYMLVDNLFSRNFMTLCSWAGGSRKETEKIAFKIYKNVIWFFFKLVEQADSNFTLEKCELFFKNILKNSARRNEMKKHGRTSTCKRRPKNLVYKGKGNEIEDNVNKSEGTNSEGFMEVAQSLHNCNAADNESDTE